MKTKLLMILLVSLFGTAIGQNTFEYCAQDAYISYKSIDTSFLAQKNIYEQLIYQYQFAPPPDAKSVLIIPVVASLTKMLN